MLPDMLKYLVGYKNVVGMSENNIVRGVKKVVLHEKCCRSRCKNVVGGFEKCC